MQENDSRTEVRSSDHVRRVFTGGTPAQKAMLVNSMARELGRSVEEITPIYEQIYERMAGTATVVDFLPALVLKNLRRHFQAIRDEVRH